MTEQEWLECTAPGPMLAFFQAKSTDRKLRLFCVACCCRIWHLLTDSKIHEFVEAAELVADGLVDLDGLVAVHERAERITRQINFVDPGPTDHAILAANMTAGYDDDSLETTPI